MWCRVQEWNPTSLRPQSSPRLIVKLQNFITLGETGWPSLLPALLLHVEMSERQNGDRRVGWEGSFAQELWRRERRNVFLFTFSQHSAWGLQLWRSSPVNSHTVRAAVCLSVLGLYLSMELSTKPVLGLSALRVHFSVGIWRKEHEPPWHRSLRISSVTAVGKYLRILHNWSFIHSMYMH